MTAQEIIRRKSNRKERLCRIYPGKGEKISTNKGKKMFSILRGILAGCSKKPELGGKKGDFRSGEEGSLKNEKKGTHILRKSQREGRKRSTLGGGGEDVRLRHKEKAKFGWGKKRTRLSILRGGASSWWTKDKKAPKSGGGYIFEWGGGRISRQVNPPL